jgi:hypothetical protein
MYGMFDGGPFAKCHALMMEAYHPEIEVSPLLDDTRASKYRAMIGSANWIVTLDRLDIAYATNCMARFSMAPREGHMIAMKRLFGYLWKFPEAEILVDPTKMDHSPFNDKKQSFDTWQEFYPDAEEDMPQHDQPSAGNKIAQITVFVDADHAYDGVTRRSVTGIILFHQQHSGAMGFKTAKDSRDFYIRIGDGCGQDRLRTRSGISMRPKDARRGSGWPCHDVW